MGEANDSAELLRLRKIEQRLVAAWVNADDQLEKEWSLLTCELLRREKLQCEKYLGYTPQKVKDTPTD